jgi:hypothetical protein
LYFTWGLFNNAVSSSDYTALYVRIINAEDIKKDLEGSGHGQIKILSQHLNTGTGENHETFEIMIGLWT